MFIFEYLKPIALIYVTSVLMWPKTIFYFEEYFEVEFKRLKKINPFLLAAIPIFGPMSIVGLPLAYLFVKFGKHYHKHED